jgi:hypothetical protein
VVAPITSAGPSSARSTAITFNNASVNADVLKSGVFGSNGTLTIGGGTLSATTELKLYAPGSNGSVNFIANVTLDSENSVIIAANAVTINNGIVVTITGDDGINASVFTNIPNYTGSGGNGSTTGMFAGNGAQTQPLDQAPPFGPSGATPTGATAPTATTASIPRTKPRLPADPAIDLRAKRHVPIARVTDSNELLDLAEKVTSGTTETGHNGSNAPTGRRSRGAESVLSTKGRSVPSAANVAHSDLTLGRDGARRAVSLP